MPSSCIVWPMGKRFISILLEYMMREYDNEELTIHPTQVRIFEPASKSKTGQSDKETQSSSAKDKSPSHLSPSTSVVDEMHKEAHQATGGPTSLGATSEEGAHPQLSSDKTKSAGDGLKTAHTDSGTNEEFRADEISKKIKLEDLSDLMKDTRSAFFTPNSPQDEPNIVHLLQSQKEKLEQQKEKAKAEVASLKARPSYPDINQLTELMVTSLKPGLSKLLTLHDFVSCLPTELKELPSKFIELSGDIKELKRHVAELKNIQWELPAEFLDLPRAASKNVPSVGQATTSPAEGEKNTSPATINFEPTNLHNELVDLLGIDIVTQEDGTVEVIPNVKVNDLHLAKWKDRSSKKHKSSVQHEEEALEWKKTGSRYGVSVEVDTTYRAVCLECGQRLAIFTVKLLSKSLIYRLCVEIYLAWISAVSSVVDMAYYLGFI
ncbi:hypothetical protein Tco_0591924 [Tanacetum coccineum]